MKNYIRDVIDRYIKHDYPAEVDREAIVIPQPEGLFE